MLHSMKVKKATSQTLLNGQNRCKGIPLQGLILETFKKFDVNLEKIRNEATLTNFEMVDYEDKNKTSLFGEKESITYALNFITYNTQFEAKLLTFEYNTKSELLKLDIVCRTASAVKEIKYCCNSLQRRRNLNLMFTTLISFSRYLESRRLVCDVILKKNKYVRIFDNKDGGIIVVYSNDRSNIKLGVFWSVEFNSDHEIFDKVEVYFKVSELPNSDQIKSQLTQLTEPHLEFNEKFHLWKDLLEYLSIDSSVIVVDKVSATDKRKNIYKQINSKKSNEDFDLDDISVLRHSKLLPDRDIIKKEEPVDDYEVNNEDTVITSSGNVNLQTEPVPLVCIKNSNLTSKHSKQASVILSDHEEVDDKQTKGNKNEHIIYIDEHDSGNRTAISKSNSSSTHHTTNVGAFPKYPPWMFYNMPDFNFQNQLSNFLLKRAATLNRTPSVEVIDGDTNNTIIVSQNKNSSRKSSNLEKNIGNSDSPDSTATVIDVDQISPSKKVKLTDDDLEITGITYLVPD